VRFALNLVALFARLAAPVLPFTAPKIAASVGESGLSWPSANEDWLSRVPVGRPVQAAEVLFRKIEDDQVAEWTERFGGGEGQDRMPG